MKAAPFAAALLAACSANSSPTGENRAMAAVGDVDAGEAAFAKCYACHSLEADSQPLDGPSLEYVVGRDVAAMPGFAYSPAMRDFAAANPRWTPELLDRFLADPQRLVPDNRMGFFGIDDPAERRALIAYLTSRPEQ